MTIKFLHANFWSLKNTLRKYTKLVQIIFYYKIVLAENLIKYIV